MQAIRGAADAAGMEPLRPGDPQAPDTVRRLAVRWAAADLPGLVASLPALKAELLAGAGRDVPHEVELALTAPAELHDDAANLLLALYRSETSLAPLLQGTRTVLSLLERPDGEPVHRLDLGALPRLRA